MSFLSRFLAPEVDRHLLVDQGEFIIDEVAKHWVTVVLPAMGIAACIPIFWAMPLLGAFWWLALLVGLGLFIFLIALCVNIIGDGLLDSFDPRTKRIPSQRHMD